MNKEISSYSSYKKSPYKSIKHSTYFPVYDRLFAQFAGKEITFVEVGVLNGGSLFMWRDFFGPKARIIGIDLNPDAKRWERDGFEIHIGSQSDPDFWNTVFAEIGEVDILLDDGGHTFEQQIVTVESALPHIKDGGLLVVEDTHTSYMKEFGGRVQIHLLATQKTLSTELTTGSVRFVITRHMRIAFTRFAFLNLLSCLKSHAIYALFARKQLTTKANLLMLSISDIPAVMIKETLCLPLGSRRLRKFRWLVIWAGPCTN